MLFRSSVGSKSPHSSSGWAKSREIVWLKWHQTNTVKQRKLKVFKALWAQVMIYPLIWFQWEIIHYLAPNLSALLASQPPRIRAPCWFSLQGRTWRRGVDLVTRQTLRREKEEGGGGLGGGQSEEESTHTAMKKCEKLHRFVVGLESFLSSPANTQGEGGENTAMNKSYGSIPKPTVASSFPKRDKDWERREPKTKKKGELKGKWQEQTPLWSFDSTLLWNMPFLDFLLNPSSVELIIWCWVPLWSNRSHEPATVPCEHSNYMSQTVGESINRLQTLIQSASLISIKSQINGLFLISQGRWRLVFNWKPGKEKLKWLYEFVFAFYLAYIFNPFSNKTAQADSLT